MDSKVVVVHVVLPMVVEVAAQAAHSSQSLVWEALKEEGEEVAVPAQKAFVLLEEEVVVSCRLEAVSALTMPHSLSTLFEDHLLLSRPVDSA